MAIEEPEAEFEIKAFRRNENVTGCISKSEIMTSRITVSLHHLQSHYTICSGPGFSSFSNPVIQYTIQYWLSIFMPGWIIRIKMKVTFVDK